MILTIRTDKPEAEIGLYRGNEQLAYHVWQAHRQLAETLHQTIDRQLTDNGLEHKDVEGIIFYKGPGSFTGLRIGAALANAWGAANAVPIVAQSGDDWQTTGIARLLKGESEPALPDYGAPARTTKPRK